MKRCVLILATLVLAQAADPALAQGSRGGSSNRSSYLRLDHVAEISAHYGYVWTGSRAAVFEDEYGDIDIANSSMWGLQVDLPVRPDAQVVLLYNRQDSDWTWKSGITTDIISPVAVEYWHIGGLAGVPSGKLMPYTQVTLGGTRYSGMQGVSDAWKFSMIVGAGVKLYLNERIAFKVQGRIPYTFFNTAFSVSGGGSGVYVTVGGTGIIQGDLSAGLSILI